jgi:hypothetical protein
MQHLRLSIWDGPRLRDSLNAVARHRSTTFVNALKAGNGGNFHPLGCSKIGTFVPHRSKDDDATSSQLMSKLGEVK